MSKINYKNLELIANILIPGDENSWRSANIIADSLHSFVCSMKYIDQNLIRSLGSELAAAAPSERIAVMQTFEASQSVLFGHIYRWLLGAYYSSPAVVARAEGLANAAPREASIHFDDRLVDRVIATKAGQYRN